MTPSQKPELVKMFLRDHDVKDVAIFFGCSEGSVQRVLREAITQLANLNTALDAQRIRAEAAAAPVSLSEVQSA